MGTMPRVAQLAERKRSVLSVLPMLASVAELGIRK